jgi:metalloendopeptidase OMA1, mitochondrial
MDKRTDWSRRSEWRRVAVVLCLVCCLATLVACGGMVPQPPEGGEGEGPGHRPQRLALSPQQELRLGEQAYAEVLQKYHDRIVRTGKEAEAIKEVGERIVRAAEIKPLQKEINLHFDERYMRWEFTLIDDRQVNAFCLPGGKVVVFTGLFQIVRNKDELAAVMGHEIGHALAHHTSERIYRNPGHGLSGLAFERAQEAEADHIGLFLMTFAGYRPEACIELWEDMGRRGGKQAPEILSDHPSDARRIAQMKEWVPHAEAALRAYKEGRIAQ